jgi:hypothetical protein
MAAAMAITQTYGAHGEAAVRSITDHAATAVMGRVLDSARAAPEPQLDHRHVAAPGGDQRRPAAGP